MSNVVAKKVFDYIIRQSKFNETAPAQFAVAEYIAVNENEPSFVGTTPEKMSEVYKWVEFACKRQGKFTSDDAKELNSALVKSTYVAYNHTISAADVFNFVSAHTFVSTNPNQITHFPSLYRWMDLIQNAFGGINEWKPKVFVDTNALQAKQSSSQNSSKQLDSSAGVDPASKHAAKLLKKESKQAEKQAKKGQAKSEANDPKSKLDQQPQSQQGSNEGSVDPTRLEVRVGVIVEAHKHPDAESLYVEKMDVGEETCRTIISGLVNHVPLAEMQNKRCLVVCNLKPVKMRGILSQGMVLCTSSKDGSRVEILNPPTNAKPGDLIEYLGFKSGGNGFDLQLNPKKKVWESIQPSLVTDQNRVAGFSGADGVFYPMHVQNQLVVAPSIADGPIR